MVSLVLAPLRLLSFRCVSTSTARRGICATKRRADNIARLDQSRAPMLSRFVIEDCESVSSVVFIVSPIFSFNFSIRFSFNSFQFKTKQSLPQKATIPSHDAPFHLQPWKRDSLGKRAPA